MSRPTIDSPYDHSDEWRAALWNDPSSHITEAEYVEMETYGTPPWWPAVDNEDTWGTGVDW